MMKKKQFYNFTTAEAPGAARVDLQPAKRLLFCKQFSKISSSAFRASGPPGPDGGGGGDQTCTKTFLGHVAMYVQKFIQIYKGGLDFRYTSPHINRQTNICAPIFIYREDKCISTFLNLS